MLFCRVARETALEAIAGQRAGQAFEAGITGSLDQVDLALGKLGVPDSPMNAEIRTVSGGVPSRPCSRAPWCS
jgi:hypothetical protein